MRSRLAALAVLLAIAVVPIPATPRERSDRPRLIVLTDIGGDPDDTQSLIRLLLYACDFEIEALIASASGVPGEISEDAARVDLIREVVRAYGQVQPNLLRHRAGYPTAGELLERVKAGNPIRGEKTLGPNGDTDGSRRIIEVVDRADDRPVNVSIWGGPTDLGQALWRVRHDRSAAEVRRFVARLRVYAIGHQDDAGPWIVSNFPDLRYLLGSPSELDVLGKSRSGLDRRLALYPGMYLGGDESLTSKEWLDAHVRRNHGPLGALYPNQTWTAPNPHAALKEGDTPSWFYFLPNGLSDPDQPTWGCWGGRFKWERNSLFRDAVDAVGEVRDARATVWRWRPAFQAEFQARMDWCVAAPKAANHPPTAVVNGDRGLRPLTITTRPGRTVDLDARGSSDPDRHELTYRWWHYPEPGTPGTAVRPTGADQRRCRVDVPADAAPGEAHVILEVRDTGNPPLTAYRRIVLRVGKRPL